MSTFDFYAALPIEVISLMALVVMLAYAFTRPGSRLCAILSIVGLVGGIVAACITILATGLQGFNGMIVGGGMANVYDIIFASAGILTVLLARDYFDRVGVMYDEFYSLVMMSVAGMMLMAHANDFMILFVGLEVMSICFYILAGLMRGRLASNEAAMKYFLLGAFASGFLLYGIALVYGAVGGTGYDLIATGGATTHFPLLFWAGIGLLIVGLGFKVAAFPFHQWAPDVYEGAPTVVTGFMSTAGKAAAFAGFIGFIWPTTTNGLPGAEKAQTVLAILAVGSMLLGNITAIAQTNLKRMLAYSSIAHAGYMLVGLVASNNLGRAGVMYYLAAYLFMQLGAFAVVGMLERENGGHLTIDDYRGLGRRRPGVAVIMSLFMFSLTGIPPFAGFFGKYTLFAAAINSGNTWLAIVGVVSSVISAWFYLGLVVAMFFREPSESTETEFAGGIFSKTALALAIAGTLIVGFIPQFFMKIGGL